MPRDLTDPQVPICFERAPARFNFYTEPAEEPAQLAREAREIVQRAGRRARLRDLLSDRRWHTTAELLAAAGSGVSSRLHELRAGADGMPALVIEVRRWVGRGCVFVYRVGGEVVPGRNLDGEE